MAVYMDFHCVMMGVTEADVAQMPGLRRWGVLYFLGLKECYRPSADVRSMSRRGLSGSNRDYLSVVWPVAQWDLGASARRTCASRRDIAREHSNITRGRPTAVTVTVSL